ncbi:hypothetical protein QN277_008237 [Acacia crassicarpa]|uniref:AP2/ERF domain-containing protein n=1 Tax=Acacia crassicarpa TaxID=499986 RepID=A0AAE1IRR2_9FABA|nr:hypothetical protein QN277_008237 [Acacia crassicarpa]
MDFENGSSSSSPCSTPTPSSAASQKRKAGRKKFRETRHPVFHGVRQRNGDRWVSEVREPNKKSRIWLGTYPNPEMAARAHDVAALALRGSSAALNFPDLAHLLPAAISSSAHDIRAAAAKAAHAFRPIATSSNAHHHNINKSKPLSVEDNKEKSNEEGDDFLDEEALYNMPSLLRYMAEGLLLSPPFVCRRTLALGFDDDDDFSCQMDLALWPDD